MAWDAYTAKLVKGGYDRGVAETNAAYTARDNKQLQAVVAAQRAAEVRAAKAEDDAAAAQILVSSNYAKGVKDGQAKTAVLVAAAKSGALRLRDPGSQTGGCTAGGSSTGAATTAAGTAGSASGAGTQLPATASGFLSTDASNFLIGLTGEADDATRQLSACQVILVSDRKLCNSP
jgi:hypothetical protein